MGGKDGKPGRRTLAVREGPERTGHSEQSEPLFLTSSFRFESAEQAAARFDDSEPGFVYSRFSNPTVETFERRLAAMEGTDSCFATASGMAAIFAAVMALCESGSRVVASLQLFGATVNLLRNYVAKFGVDVRFVDTTDPGDWAKAAGGRADLLIVESPSNPQLDVYDIAALAQVARDAGGTLLVDNCLCTPDLQNPAALGAGLVMHSATKYIDGQGRVLGGALCGDEETIRGRVRPFMRSAGPSMSPFNAWVLLKGLETVGLRVREMSRVALALAGQAEGHEAVERVAYPFLPSHPAHGLAKRQQAAGCGVVSVFLKGGREAAFRAVNATRVMSITANFGDAKSTVTHPASTTHLRVGEELRARAGITDGLVRFSAGLEDEADLREDLARALDAAR